jgi:hypothetical protein
MRWQQNEFKAQHVSGSRPHPASSNLSQSSPKVPLKLPQSCPTYILKLLRSWSKVVLELLQGCPKVASTISQSCPMLITFFCRIYISLFLLTRVICACEMIELRTSCVQLPCVTEFECGYNACTFTDRLFNVHESLKISGVSCICLLSLQCPWMHLL